MKNTVTRTKPTANETYAIRVQATNDLMARIQKQLAAHAREQAGAPMNWGYVGDIGKVNTELAQVLAGLGDGSACEEQGIEY